MHVFSRRTGVVYNCLQENDDHAAAYLQEVDRPLSLYEAGSLRIGHRHFLPMYTRVFLNGVPIKRVRSCIYIGFSIYHHVRCRPAVGSLLSGHCLRLLLTLRRRRGLNLVVPQLLDIFTFPLFVRPQSRMRHIATQLPSDIGRPRPLYQGYLLTSQVLPSNFALACQTFAGTLAYMFAFYYT